MRQRLKPRRVELKEANKFVTELHRHHKKCAGHRFSLGVEADGKLVGVAICGRPVGRNVDQKYVLEVNRVCTDGTKNACSFLYSAAVRCAREMGFRAVITYTNVLEPGTSLKAAGWWPELLALKTDYSFGRPYAKGKDVIQKTRWAYLIE